MIGTGLLFCTAIAHMPRLEGSDPGPLRSSYSTEWCIALTVRYGRCLSIMERLKLEIQLNLRGHGSKHGLRGDRLKYALVSGGG